MKTEVIRLLLIALLITIIGGYIVWQHEITHSEINKLYGCSINEIHFDFPYPYTLGGNCTGNYDNLILVHSINEIIGYNIMPALVFLFLILLMKDF